MTALEGSALTRRQLLRSAGGAMALVAAVRLPGPPPPGRGPLSLAEVLPHVGSRLEVGVGPGRREHMVLLEAVDRPGRGQGGRKVTGEAFSLLFGGAKAPIPSGTYVVHHAALGTFPLFLSPVGQSRHGQQYEAVVNHQALAR